KPSEGDLRTGSDLARPPGSHPDAPPTSASRKGDLRQRPRPAPRGEPAAEGARDVRADRLGSTYFGCAGAAGAVFTGSGPNFSANQRERSLDCCLAFETVI